MKRYILKSLIATALFVSTAVTAGAVTLDKVTFSEDFEAYKLDAAFSSGSGVFSLVDFDKGNGMTSAIKQEDEGNKALLLHYGGEDAEDAEDATGTVVMSKSFTAMDSTMSLKLRTDHKSCAINLGFRQSSTQRFWPVVIKDGAFYDNTGSKLCDIVLGDWYKVDMRYVASDDLFTISINGDEKIKLNSASSYIGFSDPATTTRIQFTGTSGIESSLWMDDITTIEANGYVTEPVCTTVDGNVVNSLTSGQLSFVSEAQNDSADELPLSMIVRVSKNDEVLYLGYSQTVVKSIEKGKIGVSVNIPAEYEGYEVECILVDSLESGKPICRSLKLN